MRFRCLARNPCKFDAIRTLTHRALDTAAAFRSHTSLKMSWFGSSSKKADPKEELKQNDREFRRTERDLDRDMHVLERQERDLEAQIKKMARTKGSEDSVRTLAKQLVSLRKQKTRNTVAKSRVGGIRNQSKVMATNVRMGEAMKTTTQTMSKMNQMMDPQQTSEIMREFAKESAKMDMSEEMINETLDDMLTESGDEAEEDKVLKQVLDEIGIEISGRMSKAPAANTGRVGESSRAPDKDLEDQLQKLRS